MADHKAISKVFKALLIVALLSTVTLLLYTIYNPNHKDDGDILNDSSYMAANNHDDTQLQTDDSKTESLADANDSVPKTPIYDQLIDENDTPFLALKKANLLFENSKSYADAVSTIQELQARGDSKSAELLKSQIDSFCSSLFLPNFGPLVGGSVSGWDYQIEYCESYAKQTSEFVMPDDAYNNHFADLINSIEDDLASSLDGDFKQKLSDLILNADTPVALDALSAAVSSLIATAGRDFRSVSSADDIRLMTSPSLSSALTIYGCQKFNNCDNSSVRFNSMCIALDNCAQFTNLVDLLYYSSSQMEIERINRIMNIINSAR